jgi:hypothetical protein
VDVRDNQLVTRDQVLFVDQERFKLALRQAQAAVADRKETLAQAQRESRRNRGLGNLVASEQLEESQSRVARAQAALAEAQVAVDSAQLNLDRTVVRSPVDGYVNDRAPRVKEFVTAGRPVLSIVDSSSFHIDGYFEETKLDGIHVGQSVDIRVIGDNARLRGHVESIVAGIEDRDRTSGQNLLPNVNPAFSWVRLAQRIPVRIVFDDVPEDFRMIAGRTATVSIIEDSTSPSPETRHESRSPGAVGLGLLLSGCQVVGPDYQLPGRRHAAPRPAGPVGGRGRQCGLGAGARRLVEALSGPASLNELVRQALASNTDLRVAAANLSTGAGPGGASAIGGRLERLGQGGRPAFAGVRRSLSAGR